MDNGAVTQTPQKAQAPPVQSQHISYGTVTGADIVAGNLTVQTLIINNNNNSSTSNATRGTTDADGHNNSPLIINGHNGSKNNLYSRKFSTALPQQHLQYTIVSTLRQSTSQAEKPSVFLVEIDKAQYIMKQVEPLSETNDVRCSSKAQTRLENEKAILAYVLLNIFPAHFFFHS